MQSRPGQLTDGYAFLRDQIDVKSGVAIDRFTETGLAFADGEVIDADLVLFATG